MTLRYAFRSLSRSPGFVVIAVLALGVGLGLSTTMFAVMDTVIHPYVPYEHPEQLYRVNWWFGRRSPMWPAELYRYLRDNTHSFSAVLPQGGYGNRLTVHAQSGDFDVGTWYVSPRYFPVTGVKLDQGRPFRAADGQDVMVVDRALWRRLFGRRGDTQDATVNAGDRVYRVLGVMPDGICETCAWLPSPPEVETNGVRSGYVVPFVRLKPGVTMEQGNAELKRLAGLLTDRFNAHDAPFAFYLVPEVNRPEQMRDIHKAMVGAALVVLLIACVNLSHLMLARGLAKRRELAVRMALGASRAAVVRQMFTECALITLAGAALGAAVTLWGVDFLRYRMPQQVSWIGLVRPQLSWFVFGLATAATAVSAVLFGLLPAIHVTLGVNLDEPLKDDSGTTTGRARQRYSPLVISEVALALVLLMGGGLLVRTVATLRREQVNFETSTLYQGWAYRRTSDTTQVARRSEILGVPRQDFLAIARGVEGVRDVAFESFGPTAGGAMSPELTSDSTRLVVSRAYDLVTPNYVRVLGLPILRGRDFAPGDAAGSGVAIIDGIAAQKLYPHQDAVGRMLKLGAPAAASARWVPIVGIVRSPAVLSTVGRDAPAPPTIWICQSDTAPVMNFVMRAARDDPRIAQRLVRALATESRISTSIFPFDYWRQSELISRGFLAKVFVAMGVVALALAALGLFGVLSYAVNRRSREFAVRMALGAAPRQLLNMVFHDGAVMLLAGTGVGAFAALAAARYLDSVLVAVLPSDVIALVLSEIVLLSVGFAAATAPARRAARANPLDIIRAV